MNLSDALRHAAQAAFGAGFAEGTRIIDEGSGSARLYRDGFPLRRKLQEWQPGIVFTTARLNSPQKSLFAGRIRKVQS